MSKGFSRVFGFGSAILLCTLATACVTVEQPGEATRGAGGGQSVGGEGGSDTGDAGGGTASGGQGTGGDGSSGPVDEASVLTWNLENFPLTPATAALVKQTLGDLAPDLVAVQEISEPAAFVNLVNDLEDYEGVLNDDPGAYTHVGLLYRKDRVTLDEVETLFPDDWYAFPRPPLKAHVTIQGETEIDFVAVVLHLKAKLDSESQSRRRVACEDLDLWLQEQLATSTEQDFMLLGDMNDKLTDEPQWNVFNVFLDQPNTYSFLTMPLAESGEFTYIPFEGMIDHVLVTADMLDEVGSGYTEVLPLDQSVDGYDEVSDHRPVRTWLRWGAD